MTFDNEAPMMTPGRPAASLIVKQGPQIGIQFPITDNVAVIGREESCDIVIQDAEVSRRHSQLSWEGNTFIIQDMESTNGTFVNGTQIDTATVLTSGDVIGLGQTTLIFESEADNYPQADYTATPSREAYPLTAQEAQSETGENTTQKWLLSGCGCLAFLCICSVGLSMALQYAGIIDLTDLPGILQNLGI